MNIFTDELMYQYITTGTFIFVINTFLLYSCINAMASNAKEELHPEEDNNNLEVDEEDEVDDK